MSFDKEVNLGLLITVIDNNIRSFNICQQNIQKNNFLQQFKIKMMIN